MRAAAEIRELIAFMDADGDDGILPYISPYHLARWALGENSKFMDEWIYAGRVRYPEIANLMRMPH